MPFLEDYGTRKGTRLDDYFTMDWTLTEQINYNALTGSPAKNASLLLTNAIYPFYWAFKICHTGGDYFQFDYRSGAHQHILRVWNNEIGWSGDVYAVDMTTPHAIEIFFVDDVTPGEVFLDGAKVLDIHTTPNATTRRFKIWNNTGTMDLYWQRIHRKPFSLIDWYWLEFLKKRVMDPAERDDPADWVKQRYPVATFPTDILKPQIDFHISHVHKPKPHPHFPHLHTSSSVNITAYLGEEGTAEGLTGVPAMNHLTSLILEALNWAEEEISVLKEHVASQPVFIHDERNKAWMGKISVKAEHLVEVF